MEHSIRYRVIVSDNAARMLVSHARFLANVSEDAAIAFTEEFNKQANSLSELPERCPWLDSPYIPKRKYRKLTFSGKYLILYQIKGEHVLIDYVVDCRQDYQWLL